MVRTPSYPKDAPVAPPPGARETPPAATDPSRAPKPSRPAESSEAGKAPLPPESKRTKHLVAGAAIGIGSAALVAALLYANRSRKS
jgi:hypothetical protein